MDVPRDFRVGMPQTFAEVFADWLTADPEKPEDSGLEGQWVRVEGEPLPVPTLARIDRASDGRLMVTGLILGLQDHREITWDTMRGIKPATILSLIFSGFRPEEPAHLMQTTDGRYISRGGDYHESLRGVEEVVVWDDPDLARAHERALAAYALWKATEKPGAQPAQEVNRPRASVATDLGAFASTYLRHFAATPQRATTATAEEMHISRATAIRRIKECRERGLIPPKEKGATP